MAIKSAGALAISEIAAEFGGSAPRSLSMYYSGGALVAAGTTPIPTAGLIKISDFYGTSAAPTLTPTTQTINGSVNGLFKSGAFTTGGFKGTITYATLGLVPSGLRIDPATGIVSGYPTSTGNGTFSIRATGSTSGSVVVQVNFFIAAAKPPTVTPNPATLTGRLNTPVSLHLIGENFGPTTTWSVLGSGVPQGMSLNPATGEISGTPTGSGGGYFTVRASSSAGSVFVRVNVALT